MYSCFNAYDTMSKFVHTCRSVISLNHTNHYGTLVVCFDCGNFNVIKVCEVFYTGYVNACVIRQ